MYRFLIFLLSCFTGLAMANTSQHHNQLTFQEPALSVHVIDGGEAGLGFTPSIEYNKESKKEADGTKVVIYDRKKVTSSWGGSAEQKSYGVEVKSKDGKTIEIARDTYKPIGNDKQDKMLMPIDGTSLIAFHNEYGLEKVIRCKAYSREGFDNTKSLKEYSSSVCVVVNHKICGAVQKIQGTKEGILGANPYKKGRKKLQQCLDDKNVKRYLSELGYINDSSDNELNKVRGDLSVTLKKYTGSAQEIEGTAKGLNLGKKASSESILNAIEQEQNFYHYCAMFESQLRDSSKKAMTKYLVEEKGMKVKKE